MAGEQRWNPPSTKSKYQFIARTPILETSPRILYLTASDTCDICGSSGKSKNFDEILFRPFLPPRDVTSELLVMLRALEKECFMVNSLLRKDLAFWLDESVQECFQTITKQQAAEVWGLLHKWSLMWRTRNKMTIDRFSSECGLELGPASHSYLALSGAKRAPSVRAGSQGKDVIATLLKALVALEDGGAAASRLELVRFWNEEKEAEMAELGVYSCSVSLGEGFGLKIDVLIETEPAEFKADKFRAYLNLTERDHIFTKRCVKLSFKK